MGLGGGGCSPQRGAGCGGAGAGGRVRGAGAPRWGGPRGRCAGRDLSRRGPRRAGACAAEGACVRRGRCVRRGAGSRRSVRAQPNLGAQAPTGPCRVGAAHRGSAGRARTAGEPGARRRCFPLGRPSCAGRSAAGKCTGVGAAPAPRRAGSPCLSNLGAQACRRLPAGTGAGIREERLRPSARPGAGALPRCFPLGRPSCAGRSRGG